MAEPAHRRTWVTALVALLAAGAAITGWLLAPGDWPTGPGSVVLARSGATVLDQPVDFGSSGAVSVRGAGHEVAFPGGVPVDAPITAIVTGPELDDLELYLVLPDGRTELVPMVGEEGGSLIASRRPATDAPVALALLGAVVVLWVSGIVPLWVTSLAIPVVLVVTGVAGATDAVAPFFNPIIVLFFAGFLMAEAMRRCGLDHHVAVAVVARAGRSGVGLFAVLVGLAAFLSMWMSNTAAAAVLVPIALAVSEPIRHDGFRRAAVLGIAYAATIGGVGSAIGTPANQLAIEFLDGFGARSISFAGWFPIGLPLVVLLLPVMGAYLWWRSDVRLDRVRLAEVRATAIDEARRLGRLDRDQAIVLAVFGLVAVGWLTQTWHGIHPGIVALGGAVALGLLGRIRSEDLGRISWSSLLTFGGGLTLGLALVTTGASDELAARLTGLAGLPTVVAVGAVAIVTLVLTTVASNTASAAILIPLAIPLARVVGIDPVALVAVVAIASSIDFALVVGTPPTMVAYSTDLFTSAQIARRGSVLDVVGIALLVLVVVPLWGWLGVV